MPKISEKSIENSPILSTKKVDEIMEKENLGIPLHRHEKLWFKNMPGVRKAGLNFALTNNEIEEYAKSKLSIHYFAENFCKIKLETGIIGKMTLREYQKDIIDLYTRNRYSILMASRQTGKCSSFDSEVLLLDEETNETYSIPFFEFYYQLIRENKPLTFLEKSKLFLYRLYIKI